MRWLFRRREPVTFTDGGMLRIRMTVTKHTTPPKAERFKIKNPLFYLLRMKKQRARA